MKPVKRLAQAVNFAYPIGDMVLVTMLVAVFAVQGWRLDRRWWTLGAGLVIFAIADSVYVLRVLGGTYQTGYPLDSLWMVGTFLMAIAAWQTPRRLPERTRDTQPVVVPGAVVAVLGSDALAAYSRPERPAVARPDGDLVPSTGVVDVPAAALERLSARRIA